jgi:hypothetical protein
MLSTVCARICACARVRVHACMREAVCVILFRRVCDAVVVWQGYMRLKRGEGAKCNIGTGPMFPIKNSPNPDRKLRLPNQEAETRPKEAIS